MKIGNIIGAVGLTIGIAAGGVILGLQGDGEILDADGGSIDGKPIEKEIAVRHVVVDGKKLRVVGGKLKENADVADTELGRTVEAEAEEGNQLQCSVILHAQEVTGNVLYGNESKQKYPNLPDLKDYMLRVRPVPIAGSCIGKDCYWNGMFFDNACVLAVKSPGYLLSSMQEALAQPLEIKRRLLQIEGTCETDDHKQYNCHVPFGDPRAKAAGEIIMPHSWSLGDSVDRVSPLNYAKGKNDAAIPRYSVDDFRTVEAEIEEIPK